MTLAFVECNIVGVGVLDFRPEHASTSETRLRALAPGRGVEYANVTAFSFGWRRNDHVEKCVAAAVRCCVCVGMYFDALVALGGIVCSACNFVCTSVLCSASGVSNKDTAQQVVLVHCLQMECPQTDHILKISLRFVNRHLLQYAQNAEKLVITSKLIIYLEPFHAPIILCQRFSTSMVSLNQ